MRDGATRGARVRQDERAIGSLGERSEMLDLLGLELHTWDALRRPMHPHIRHAIEPREALRVEVGVTDELAAVEEVTSEVADRTLDLAFRLRAVRTTRPDPEAPVGGEAEEMGSLQRLGGPGQALQLG